MRICEIEGCDQKHVARGYCKTHWTRWKIHGDPLIFKSARKQDRKALTELFWRAVDIRSEDECWLWQNAIDEDGYGRANWYTVRGKRVRIAHRIAYEIFYKVEPGELQVCHKCDNPPCVNPHHLFLGTNKDNHADKKAKGRAPKGGRNWSSAFYDKHIPEVRRLRFEEKLTNKQIAQRYGVSESTISHICTGRSWKHVPMNAENLDFVQDGFGVAIK
jgi:DNA-binding XRE family transcriptional regulator